MKDRILTLNGGFQWLILTKEEATLLYETKSYEVYVIDDCGEESLIQDHTYFERFSTFGIALGFRWKVGSVKVAEIVDNHIHGIYKDLQDKIGQSDGGFAGTFHLREGGEGLVQQLVEFFIEYSRAESKNVMNEEKQ